MTLNQQYKKSGSSKSFKEWLYDQQVGGKIDFQNIEEIKLNANGDEKLGLEVLGIPISYILIGAVLIVGGVVIYKRLNR